MAKQSGSGDWTWLVLARDVSDSVQVGDQPTVAAAIVMDAKQGLILGSSVADTSAAAMRDALLRACADSQSDRNHPHPSRILCAPSLARDLREQLPLVRLNQEIATVEPSAEAEDVF